MNWYLHFPSHPCDSGQEAEGSPGTAAADALVSVGVVAPTPPAARSPAAPAPAAAAARPPGGGEARTRAAARGPETQSKRILF